MRTYIQELAVDSTSLMDSCEVLLKHHSNFICEEVRGDIYRKCHDFVKAECTTKQEAVDYLEEKIGADPKMKNIVMRKILANFDVVDKETKEAEEMVKIKEKLADLEAGVEQTKENVKDVEHKIAKCSNCKMFDCKEGELVKAKLVQPGLKVKSSISAYHACSYHRHPQLSATYGNAKLSVPLGTTGVLREDFSVEWMYTNGNKVRCNCTKHSNFNNILYRCK